MSAKSDIVLVSGGAGYIGSHVAHLLRASGFTPMVVDSLVNGHGFAAGPDFRQGDIADTALIRALVRDLRPVAALHFAAFIEVGESVANPAKYFENNRDKAKIFFDTLASEGVDKIVFSSRAAVYGEGDGLLTEAHALQPVNPYGQSKLAAEEYLRGLPGMASVTLRYFNVAGAAPEVGLGEAHFPESHLMPLIGLPEKLLAALGLDKGFAIYGDDYDTRDGSAVRDYVHVLYIAQAHVAALRYLIAGGKSDIFNLGSSKGTSVKEIVAAARSVLARPDFSPPTLPRRAGDPAMLVANSDKAQGVLGWRATRSIGEMIESAAAWHRSETYRNAILGRLA